MRKASFSITTFEVTGVAEGVGAAVGKGEGEEVSSTFIVSVASGLFLSPEVQAVIVIEHTMINAILKTILGGLFKKMHRFLLEVLEGLANT